MTGGFVGLGSARAQAIVLLVLAFLAGAYAGGAFERVLLSKDGNRGRPRTEFRDGEGRGRGRGGRGSPLGRGGEPEQGLMRFYDRLGITSEQRAQIESIIRKRRARMDSLMRVTWPAVRALQDSTRAEIDAVLTPAQRAREDSLRSRGRPMRGPPDSGRPASPRGPR